MQAYCLSTVRAGFQSAGKAKTWGAKALWVSPGSLFITGSVRNWRQDWDVAWLVLAEGSCLQRGKLCREPRHQSVAESVLLSVALGWRPAELAVPLPPRQGQIFLAGTAWPERCWRRCSVKRQAQGENRNLERNCQSRDTCSSPKQLHKCQLTAFKCNI